MAAHHHRVEAIVGVLVLGVGTAAVAAPPPRQPIVDRDFSIELHQGTAASSVQIVGMGGASISSAEGSAGILANPASVAAWKATSTRIWDWDWHLGVLFTESGQDLDNNGFNENESDDFLDGFLSFGLIGRYGQWSAGAAVSLDTSPITDENFTARGSVIQLAGGHSTNNDNFNIGATVTIGAFQLREDGGEQLFSVSGTGFESGIIWRPYQENFRLGASGKLPYAGEEVTVAEGCDPMNCRGFILPQRVVSGWEIGIGGSYRFGEHAWNQKVGALWRDERYVIVSADLVVTGSVDNGHSLESFAEGQLQPSGENATVSARAGAEVEVFPSWLRLRGGTYWEPSRFEGVSGRMHGTVGIDSRLFGFCVPWVVKRRFRSRISLVGDFANDYSNFGLSIGLWH